MTTPRELDHVECAELISDGGIGRIAFATPEGPEIYPVNFTVDSHAIHFRTTAYSRLGRIVDGKDVAFEVDHLNWSTRQGWSVVLKGRAEVIDDPDEVDRLRELGHEPQPWAQGMRRLYVRIAWKEITGREVGEEWLGSSRPAS
jgi:nitroimidazol reductase NimA-like FMN-containing flavoprotein (pyridoxamine 5'-phosphate oxidase superfamily)